MIYDLGCIPSNIPKARRAKMLAILGDRINRILRNSYFVFEYVKLNQIEVFNNNFKLCKASDGFYQVAFSSPQKFTITFFIACKESNGKNKLITEVMDIKTPCPIKDLKFTIADYLMDFAADTLQNKKGGEVVSCGWCASIGRDIEDENLFKILDENGIFDTGNSVNINKLR